ncbi:MAG: double-transrane region domain protein [Gemmatimonadetes bacterium]|nr:double-transrane region domain protein [Gemmatimonadota bacterium]
MNFLAPAFLAGLAAIAVPVIIHLINRERKVVVEFPSLMFLERIPYRSVRRQKIRHLLLLILRCIALALLVAAFARPFFAKRRTAVGTTGAREVVILLDRSASMGYADRWTKARDAARKVIGRLSSSDHGTLVLFAGDASVANEATATPERIAAALSVAKLSAEPTRYAPALKLASQIISASTLPRREVVLISDYQKVGWVNHNEISFPPGTVVTTTDIGGGATPNVAVAQVTTDRDSTGDRDHVTVAARLINTGAAPKLVTATLAIGGRDVQTKSVNLPASGAQQVAFTSIAVPSGATKGAVRITPDSLTPDDVLAFTIAPDDAVPVLVIEPSGSAARANQSLYLSRALAIGDRPSFRVTEKPADALTPRDFDGRALVVLDETAPPGGAVGARLRALLEGGGGIVIVPGSGRVETWPAEWRALLPATVGAVVDRTADAGGTLSSLDYAHPIFELFNAPRSGDFSTARFYRYRALTPQPGATVPARFDDGSPAMVERSVGTGKVVMWASTFDPYWTNLPLQPVFLPFVHQLGKHVGRYADPRASFIAGEVLDLSRHGELTAPFTAGRAADSSSELTLEAPSGARERVTATGANHLVTLREQGFYELRGRTTPTGSGRPIAVNVDPAESDLSHLDPPDVVVAVTAVDGQRQPGSDVNTGTPQDQEQRQKIWWYLLLGAVVLMAVETVLSNRLSKAMSS